MIVNGKERYLTKEETITEHRKMWNWIAEQYANGKKDDIDVLKEKYVLEKGITYLCFNCFSCDYTSQFSGLRGKNAVCSRCPFVWENSHSEEGADCLEAAYLCLSSLTHNIDFNTDDATKLSMEIANLPVNKEA